MGNILKELNDLIKELLMTLTGCNNFNNSKYNQDYWD